jgi:hypothetical protein
MLYLNACSALGIARQSLFNVSDLYDRKDMAAVLGNMQALARVAATHAPHLLLCDADSDSDSDSDDDDADDRRVASGKRSSVRKSYSQSPFGSRASRALKRTTLSVFGPVAIAVLLRVIVGTYVGALTGMSITGLVGGFSDG